MDFRQTPRECFETPTRIDPRKGVLPYTVQELDEEPAGAPFRYVMALNQGADPKKIGRAEVQMLGSNGGIMDGGKRYAYGEHAGHSELYRLMKEFSTTLDDAGYQVYASFSTGGCDGVTQNGPGMRYSLFSRSAITTLQEAQIAMHPTAKARAWFATCDKELPGNWGSAASMGRNLPGIFVLGGTMTPARSVWDMGSIQAAKVLFQQREKELHDLAEAGCAACGGKGGGCTFGGTAWTMQCLVEAAGMSLPRAASCPSDSRWWIDMARRSALQLDQLLKRGIVLGDILTREALHNAVAVHIAIGGSSNAFLHLPFVTAQAKFEQFTTNDWIRLSEKIPQMVKVQPNGSFFGIDFWFAGGVPEVMLHLKRLGGVLKLDCMTALGVPLGEYLSWWETSEERLYYREQLQAKENIDPDEVIVPPEKIRARGEEIRAFAWMKGNLAERAIVKCSGIKPRLFENGIYHRHVRARIFTSQEAAIAGLSAQGDRRIQKGDVIVVICQGMEAAGLPELASLTTSMKDRPEWADFPIITDGRWSGYSGMPAIGHVVPEAVAGGALGKLHEGDKIEIHIDANTGVGRMDLIGDKDSSEDSLSAKLGIEILRERTLRDDVRPDADLSDSLRLLGILSSVSGGANNGFRPDPVRILQLLRRGLEAESQN